MNRLTPVAALCFALLGGCAQTHSPADPAQSVQTNFNSLMDQYWQASNQYDSLLAGSHNPRRGAGHLPDLSPAALAAEDQYWQQFKRQVEAVPAASLGNQDQISKTMLIYELDNRIDNYRFGDHLMPLTSEYGFWVGLAGMKDYLRFQKDADFDAYLTALGDVPRYIDQQIAWMKEGLAKGITQPKAVLGLVGSNINSYINEEQFLSPFDALPQSDPRRAKANEVVDKAVLPAFNKLHDFMVNTYIPNARTSIGMSEMPNGREWYKNRVKHYVTLDISPEQVHQLGLTEMKHIHEQMNAIIQQLHFKGDLHDFMQFLRTDPQFYAKTPLELLKDASYYAKRADGILPRYFGKLPRKPYTVTPVPADIAPNYTSARYSGSYTDDRPGEFWVNTYNLKVRPIYELAPLTLHEAVPGHHLQISLTQEQTGLPAFRRNGYISAFGEGWGLYSEYLGEEAGFYQTPYEHFARLIFDAWRAARLVVDTGVHWYGWSREQAQKYMADNTGLSLHNVQTETDRYITWPGQALSYKMGELTILRLREKAQTELGDKFDIRRFHDAVLANGAVPLKVLEQQIDQFIATEQARKD
ncbi:MAG: DUF885 domain-containing protein [Pseudomonadota bacterium]|uniref:Uncharacterized protein (DUF885 family) n=1 Tax=Gallaecimonas pentaromativorans TaxID=584787 RepID=A0A3N1NZB5_9GAMM|nr:DUF885 domain-containing protein [Gallaecimonas pentaromativorans]MED5524875.1 DUF885 domain-containing protein [Pseudomonadota bacterium]ROQ24322.1 uncharacterized protein (DUF885 family) [Gallaecimonas pentaromativorans]